MDLRGSLIGLRSSDSLTGYGAVVGYGRLIPRWVWFRYECLSYPYDAVAFEASNYLYDKALGERYDRR